MDLTSSGNVATSYEPTAADAAQPLSLIRTTPSGVDGLDKVLGGGLPVGRSLLLMGTPGSGKTLLALQFIVSGAREHQEPGLFISFEESVADITANASGFGWDLKALVDDGKIHVGQANAGLSAGVEAGEVNLEGLFLRLEHAADSVNAKRAVLDGLSNLLAAFEDKRIIRSELLRLFHWFKARGITLIATAEQSEPGKSRHGFEEYLADGFITMENRVEAKVAKRQMRVVKCRGMNHVTDELPFRIGESGVTMFPVTAASMNYQVSNERIKSGIEGLDTMLGGKGVYRGSTILISGSAGTGKSSIGASFMNEAWKRGEKALLFSFEESPHQIMRNMGSIGLDLASASDKDRIRIVSLHSVSTGLEGTLNLLQSEVSAFEPAVVVIDPISSLLPLGTELEVKSLLMRAIDYLRSKGVTTILTNLASGGRTGEQTELAISSIADTWILVRVLEHNAERNYVLQVLKSRGMNHSNKMAEFAFTPKGIAMIDPYIGLDGVVLGSARATEQAKARLADAEQEAEIERQEQQIEARKRAIKAKIDAMQAEFDVEMAELQANQSLRKKASKVIDATKEKVTQSRNG